MGVKIMLATILLAVQLLPLGIHASDEFSAIHDAYETISSILNEEIDLNKTVLERFIHLISHPLKITHTDTPDNEYDFIIIGGGSSGSVIANRLSEIFNWRILLLEAGGVENFLASIPMVSLLLQNSILNWNYLAEYQPCFAKGMDAQSLAIPSGKVLGGSSVINNMVYSRGNPVDYDRWAAKGNPGWNYKNVLPYFMKSEKSRLRHSDVLFHGSKGLVSIEDAYMSHLGHVFIRAGGELGYTKYIDYNSYHQIGFGIAQGTVLHGRRHSAARAFLYPVRKRRNLDIVLEAHVTKIDIDPKTKTAKAVEFVRKGRTVKVNAKREIILSAGTFNSAQLLMLSGIGPKDQLQHFGIPLIKDLPVGEHLHQQIVYLGLIFTSKEKLEISRRELLSLLKASKYLKTGKGPLGSLLGTQALAYIKSNASKDESSWFPNIELSANGLSLSTDFGIITERTMRFRSDVYNTHWRPYSGLPTWYIAPTLLHPRSVGKVKLRSKNPFVSPVIYGNQFTDPDQVDIKTLIAGIRFIFKVINTEAFQKHKAKYLHSPIPGCEEHVFDSDDYWECALRTLSTTASNAGGTNRMGPSDDPHSVVDSELKVHGIKNLRVADCSVIPVTLSARFHATAMMIGEKAADMIKRTWPNYAP